jgi:hypothetical protein
MPQTVRPIHSFRYNQSVSTEYHTGKAHVLKIENGIVVESNTLSSTGDVSSQDPIFFQEPARCEGKVVTISIEVPDLIMNAYGLKQSRRVVTCLPC